MLKSIFKKIPYIEAIRAFMEQWGLWKGAVWLSSFVGAGAMSAYIYLTEAVPGWAAIVVGLFVFAVLLAIIFFGFSLALKWKQSKMLDRIVHIDRDALATELLEMSRKIAALAGDFRGPIQEAWWQGEGDPNSINLIRTSQSKLEGQMIERYSTRYAADVWILIRRASKVVPIDRGDTWKVEHGVRGEHDLLNVFILLAKLSDDVRNPLPPLAMTDHGPD